MSVGGLGSRPNRVVIDPSAVTSNARTVRNMLGSSMDLFAALKANAYGHGTLLVAQAALVGGATGLAVGDLESATKLRDHGIRAPILVYPGVAWDSPRLALASKLGLMVTLTDRESVLSTGSAAPTPLNIVLKVDVGHWRLGTPPSGIRDVIAAVKGSRKLRFVGVIAHLYDAPNLGAGDVQWQLDRMSGALDMVEAMTPLPRYRVVPSTGALLRHAAVRFDPRFNTADPGRLLLGVLPSETASEPQLRPAFVSFDSRLIQVRELEQDHAPFSVHGGSDPRRIGIIPVGRADGLSAVHTGQVLVCGELAPIVGQWIEHTTIDLSNVPSAQAGDQVTIIGAQGNKKIKVDDVLVAHPELRRVDVTLSISNSIPRVETRA